MYNQQKKRLPKKYQVSRQKGRVCKMKTIIYSFLGKDVAGYKLYCMPGLVAEAAA